MKRITGSIFIAVFWFLLSGMAVAQQQITVPLSHPGRPGKLSLGVVRGSITVSGYDGKNVLVNYNGDESAGRSQKVTKNGLHRISSSSDGFQAEEDNNHVSISGTSPMHALDFKISVPKNFSLDLSMVNGAVKVNDVSGELDISNVNGDVTLTNVGGAASVNTANGKITATFRSVNSDKPMAFSNINGDIDVTLPAGAKLSARMKSQFGEVYTDFDMNINHTDKKQINTGNSGTYKVSINDWIYGTINGGGPEYQFKTLRGDIYIRKVK